MLKQKTLILNFVVIFDNITVCTVFDQINQPW